MTLRQVTQAAARLRESGVILHATEGVWGLACDAFDEAAVARLLSLKQRPVSKGLIVIGASEVEFGPELAALGSSERSAVLESWPGAVTWLVPNKQFPRWITGGRTTVAVRVPGHPQARALCAEFGGPLVSTSANPGGRPPALTALTARGYFPRQVDYLLPGDVIRPGISSSIRDLSGAVLRGAG